MHDMIVKGAIQFEQYHFVTIFFSTPIGSSLMKACYNIQRCQLPIPTISLVTKVLFTPNKHTPIPSGKNIGM
jgi:uncharacterized protein YukJ